MALNTVESLTINEGNSFRFEFALADDDATPVLLSSIDSLSLTYYDVATKDTETGGIINSRENQDVLNDNDFTVTDGEIVWAGQPEDADIIGTVEAGSLEKHIAKLTCVYSGGTKRVVKPVTVYVRAADKE